MCVAPWGGKAGHVFNQRQQNAFIKPITGKSCGTEPHSHFNYSLSGDSHLHLTIASFLRPLWIRLGHLHLLLHSFICSTQVCKSPASLQTWAFRQSTLHLATFRYILHHFTIMTLKEKDLCDLYFLTLKDFHGSSNGWKNSVTLELIKICRRTG